MLEFIASLSLEQQVALGGSVVAVLMYLGRYIFRSWFADQDHAAKFEKLALALVLSAFAAMGQCLTDGVSVGCLLWRLLLIFGVSQAEHAGISKAMKLKKGEA